MLLKKLLAYRLLGKKKDKTSSPNFNTAKTLHQDMRFYNPPSPNLGLPSHSYSAFAITEPPGLPVRLPSISFTSDCRNASQSISTQSDGFTHLNEGIEKCSLDSSSVLDHVNPTNKRLSSNC